jgi:hypothetical protein
VDRSEYAHHSLIPELFSSPEAAGPTGEESVHHVDLLPVLTQGLLNYDRGQPTKHRAHENIPKSREGERALFVDQSRIAETEGDPKIRSQE